MLKTTVVIPSSPAPNKTACPSEKMCKEDLSDIETKEITSDKRRKMESLTVNVESWEEYLLKSFSLKWTIKQGIKFRADLQRRNIMKNMTARVKLFTPFRLVWLKILKTWSVGCLGSDPSHHHVRLTCWAIFFLSIFLTHSATGSKDLDINNFSNYNWSLTMVSVFIIFLSTWC